MKFEMLNEIHTAVGKLSMINYFENYTFFRHMGWDTNNKSRANELNV